MSKLLIVGIGGGVGCYTSTALVAGGYTDFVGVDVNVEAARQKLPAEWKTPLYASMPEAFAAEDLGGVYICTPDTAHLPNIEEALTFGVPVLCEKPMGNTREEARAILEAARRGPGWLQIGFEYRFSAAFWRVHEILESRELGRPLNVINEYCSGPYGPDSWRLETDKNPGLFNEKLGHIVDLFRFWLEDEIAEVQAFAGAHVLPWYPPDLADNVLGVYRFRHGGLGILIHNHVTAAEPAGLSGLCGRLQGAPGADLLPWTQAGHAQRSVVICERGTVICDVWAKTVVVNERVEGSEMQVKRVEDFRGDSMTRISHDMHGEVVDFIHRFEQGLPPRLEAEDSYRSSIATLASEEALRSGQIVKLEEP